MVYPGNDTGWQKALNPSIVCNNVSSYKEKYRPQYHFTPEANWLNDPNGLVFFKGEYHLFYQHNPLAPVWGNIHWGHAVSEDLVHWKHLPLALKPDSLGYIFSGSVVLDRNDTSGFFDGGSGLVAIYTNARKRGEDDYLQRQSIAFSRDRGRSWTKYANNPVIENPGLRNFRDPRVFWHGDPGRWIMVVTSESRVRFYGSHDLKNWTYLSEFGAGSESNEGVWECPDLFNLTFAGKESRWILVVSNTLGGKAGGSRIRYFLGEFDGVNFIPDHPSEEALRVDYGQDFYAAQTWSNLPGNRRVWIGWMSNLRYSQATPSLKWRGAMSTPRELDLTQNDGEFHLIQRPINELRQLRAESWNWKGLKVSQSSNCLSDITGKCLEIKLSVQPGTGREFGLKLRKGDGLETVVGYTVEERTLFFNRAKSGKTDFSNYYLGKHEVGLDPTAGRIKLHVFLDGSSVEVFANEGKKVISNLIFPEASGEDVELYVKEGEIKISNLEIYRLNSIWS